jgi:hypothetical protein
MPSSFYEGIILCTSLRIELRRDFHRGFVLVNRVGYKSLVNGSHNVFTIIKGEDLGLSP